VLSLGAWSSPLPSIWSSPHKPGWSGLPRDAWCCCKGYAAAQPHRWAASREGAQSVSLLWFDGGLRSFCVFLAALSVDSSIALLQVCFVMMREGVLVECEVAPQHGVGKVEGDLCV
jgi:hypothetical protein